MTAETKSLCRSSRNAQATDNPKLFVPDQRKAVRIREFKLQVFSPSFCIKLFAMNSEIPASVKLKVFRILYMIQCGSIPPLNSKKSKCDKFLSKHGVLTSREKETQFVVIFSRLSPRRGKSASRVLMNESDKELSSSHRPYEISGELQLIRRQNFSPTRVNTLTYLRLSVSPLPKGM